MRNENRSNTTKCASEFYIDHTSIKASGKTIYNVPPTRSMISAGKLYIQNVVNGKYYNLVHRLQF